MTVTFIMHVIGLFSLVAASEMLNGIARTVFLNKRVGVQNAKRISLLPALSLFMGLFDVAVGRFIVKARWEAILDDFNIRKGNLLGLGMVAMAFCPLLASRIGRY